MRKFRLLHFLMISLFVLASIANSSHTVELDYDHCDDALVLSDHTLPAPSDSEQESDDHSDHQHKCCHHGNFLSNFQNVSFLESDRLLAEAPPEQLISDPHTRSPFQPPRA